MCLSFSNWPLCSVCWSAARQIEQTKIFREIRSFEQRPEFSTKGLARNFESVCIVEVVNTLQNGDREITIDSIKENSFLTWHKIYDQRHS